MDILKKSLTDLKVVTASLVLLIEMCFFGLLSAEVWRLSMTLSGKINAWVYANNIEYGVIATCVLGVMLLVLYLAVRGLWGDIKRIVRSWRLDILAAFGFGVWISVAWGGFFSTWYTSAIAALNINQTLTIIAAPFVIGLLVITRFIFWKRTDIDSTLIVDEELHDKEDDLLNFSDKADRFAERIYNGGSPESFVFGVDAPWGIGKSTFINFCQQYWLEKHADKVVVYRFSPLRHLGAKNLLEVFIDGLIHAIQKEVFIPEIKPLISRYARLLKATKSFSFFGVSVPVLRSDYTAEEACDDLSVVLERFPRKVIVVIDDLDRISFSEIQDILFVIRKSFAFPNVSYVICYDTENIGALEARSTNSDKISEFLEKFVNIKISLYLERSDLANYVSENLEKAIATSLVDPLPVRQAIGGLLDIFSSPQYHQYLPFVGDVRKLKRLINTVMMFDLQATDFPNSDFDKRDLINLLLIYIHYPSVFRKIYDTETKGGRGFFSLVIPYDDGYPRDTNTHQGTASESAYKNSTHYHDYVEQFSENSGQRFLLDQVFNVNVRLKGTGDTFFATRNDYAKIDNVPEDVRTQLACFNGGWTNGRNLETYLDLIVNLSKPVNIGQHKFYMNWRDQLTSDSVTLTDAFAQEEFDFGRGEYSRERLWRILVNNARSIKPQAATKVIEYLLDTIMQYSLLEVESIGLGLRHNLDYFLTRLLNDAGWADGTGGHSHNQSENLTEIAEWVFGFGRHAGKGVLDALSAPERGALGLHDLMLFRLSCSADRGGDIFDLSRALAQHANQNAPTQGDTRVIAREEMREISQRVFAIFKKQYIDAKKNILDEIAKLGIGDFAGSYKEYLEGKISDGTVQKVDIDKKIIEMKTRVGSFIIYQLGNSEISHGVGCGFYDPEGSEDNHSIRDLMNDYLYDVCFDPSNSQNAEYFMDYLFRNFASALASSREDGMEYVPSINEFTRVLDKVKLADFWQKYGGTFKALKLEENGKAVFVGNNEATYAQYVPLVYKVLDDNVVEVQASAQTIAVATNPPQIS